MMLGIGVTNKMARLWPGVPSAMAIHEYTGLLGWFFAGFHALILLGDQYSHYNLVQLLMPFGSVQYRPTWVGVGQLGFYAWFIIAVTFYIRKLIGKKTWRVIHYASFVCYLAVRGPWAGERHRHRYGLGAGFLLDHNCRSYLRAGIPHPDQPQTGPTSGCDAGCCPERNRSRKCPAGSFRTARTKSTMRIYCPMWIEIYSENWYNMLNNWALSNVFPINLSMIDSPS